MAIPSVRGVLRIGPRGWCDAARAVRHLVRARRRHADARFDSAGIDRPSAGASVLDERQRRLVERVRFAVPTAAHYLGWPSDCLIQALAAQEWLGARGISSRIVLGGRTRPVEGFDAHAWLMVGAREVTGWSNSEAGTYTRFPPRDFEPGANPAQRDI